MLWAIDVGNTHSVVGIHDHQTWRAAWRFQTLAARTEDELAAVLLALCQAKGLPFRAEGLIVASVVPTVNRTLARLAEKWLETEAVFLRTGADVGLEVVYDPPHAVGADRIANAIAALEILPPPLIVVDFGTATTFDCVDAQSRYVGGAILPGVEISTQALVRATAKLPQFELDAPERAVGRTTVESLQSGVVLGYAGAIDALAGHLSRELGPARVIATGGLGEKFAELCERIERYEANLLLEGLRVAWSRMRARRLAPPAPPE